MKKYLKALKGFPVGNLVLILTYVIVYFLDGNEVYTAEMSKLLWFRFMLSQVVFSGITYVVVFETIIIMRELFEENSINVKNKSKVHLICKYAIIYLALLVIALLASKLIRAKGSLKGYIGTCFMGSSILFMIVASIAYVVVQTVQTVRINKALKEKQAKNENK